MIQEHANFMASQFKENSVDSETLKSPGLSWWLSSCVHLWENIDRVSRPHSINPTPGGPQWMLENPIAVEAI